MLANNLFHFFQAFDLKRHPLGQLVNRLVDVFRASYVGMGTHRRLLPHAVAETKSFVIRVYSIVRYDLGPVQTPIFSWAKPNSNWGRPKLFRPAEFIQTPIVIAAELSSKVEKCSFRSNCLQNTFNVWYMKSSASESKSLQRRNSRSG